MKNETGLSETVQIKVPFHDVDMMEVAWHGHYTKYFEVARCALLDSLQFNYPEMKASGYVWPIVDLRVKYIRPARFGQTIAVTCSLVEYENRCVLSYHITDTQTGEKLTQGKTVQVAVDTTNGELQLASPRAFVEKVEAAMERVR